MFLKATVVVPNADKISTGYAFDAYNIGNLDSPVVQRILMDLEELQYLKVGKLGLLLIREVSYTKLGGILIRCRKVKDYTLEGDNIGKISGKEEASTQAQTG